MARSSPTHSILTIGDALRRELEARFAETEFRFEATEQPLALARRLEAGTVDAVLTRLTAGDDDVETARLVQEVGNVPLFVVATPGDRPRAIRSLEVGVEDYLLEPIDLTELRTRVGRVIERRDLDSRLAFYHGEVSRRGGLDRFEVRSRGMQTLLQRVERVAPMRSTVLITGESGVGKELVARSIHFHSPRRDQPFIALNCAAIPEGLIESELFGHEKGSFTGAHSRSAGKFEIANGGTLFLDEIGEMDPTTQAKLLRVLDGREFMRVGGTRSLRVDVRVIAATNADLETMVRDGRFRRDLYYRLKVIVVHVPPLRERREDLEPLTKTFLAQLARSNAIPVKTISPRAMQALVDYDWPGNVRELKNLLESVLVSTKGRRIEMRHLPEALQGRKAAGAPLQVRVGTTLAEMERELIRATLESRGGNRTHAAEALGIGVRTLQRKIRAYRIQIPSTRRGPRKRATPDP